MTKRVKRNKDRLEIQLSKEDKEFIKAKAEKLDYETVSAFLVKCAKEHLVIRLDLSDYREIAKEINYIGKNINSLVRRINAEGFYSDVDLETIAMNQEKIMALMNKEYGRLLRKKEKYVQGDLSKREQKILIEHFTKENLQVPKSMLLEEVFDRIGKDIAYICGAIEKSSIKDDGFDDYIWGYVYKDKTLYQLEPDQLIQFSDELFMYTEKIKSRSLL